MMTGAYRPAGAGSDGHDAIAEASDAHEDFAPFSERLRIA